MPKHLKFILLAGAICDPRWTWRNRDLFKIEWRRAAW